MLLILSTPSLRGLMESDMMSHMLLQLPLLFFTGWLLAKGVSSRTKECLQQWNYAGITGLLLVTIVLMFWMIPRALDLVLTDPALESAKLITLSIAGAALELSWYSAGMIVRGFFLGNVLPMMMVAGWLYIEAPVRLCNAYLSSDQLRTGSGLLALAIAGSLIWLHAFFMQTSSESTKQT